MITGVFASLSVLVGALLVICECAYQAPWDQDHFQLLMEQNPVELQQKEVYTGGDGEGSAAESSGRLLPGSESAVVEALQSAPTKRPLGVGKSEDPGVAFVLLKDRELGPRGQAAKSVGLIEWLRQCIYSGPGCSGMAKGSAPAGGGGGILVGRGDKAKLMYPVRVSRHRYLP